MLWMSYLNKKLRFFRSETQLHQHMIFNNRAQFLSRIVPFSVIGPDCGGTLEYSNRKSDEHRAESDW